jgi:drug/metabolite transporter (DMT)-like permease
MAQAVWVRKLLAYLAFFIGGSFNTIFSNILFNIVEPGFHKSDIIFRRPWFQTWGMFAAMGTSVFATPVLCDCYCPKYEAGGKLRGWPLFRAISVPALCDMSGSGLANIALLFLHPSVWQMFRGSLTLGTAALSILIRHKKLRVADWVGLACVVIGIVIVGSAELINKHKGQDEEKSVSVGMQVLAMFLVIVSQTLQSFQCVYEEMILQDVDATPAELVGFEGIWGTFYLTFCLLPLCNVLPESWGEGIYENTLESVWVAWNHPYIILLFIAYIGVAFVYNLGGAALCAMTSAIHRTIYESLRSVTVWILSVILYYAIPSVGAGEPIGIHSLLQGAGFIVLVFGSAMYHRFVKFPCFDYGDELSPEGAATVSDASLSQITPGPLIGYTGT